MTLTYFDKKPHILYKKHLNIYDKPRILYKKHKSDDDFLTVEINLDGSSTIDPNRIPIQPSDYGVTIAKPEEVKLDELYMVIL